MAIELLHQQLCDYNSRIAVAAVIKTINFVIVIMIIIIIVIIIITTVIIIIMPGPPLICDPPVAPLTCLARGTRLQLNRTWGGAFSHLGPFWPWIPHLEALGWVLKN